MALLIIGDEILAGKIEDTNSCFLCRELYAIGWRVAKACIPHWHLPFTLPIALVAPCFTECDGLNWDRHEGDGSGFHDPSCLSILQLYLRLRGDLLRHLPQP